VNHIALIVSDVGRSSAFYSDVLGFQQVRRPNFDRHGAWFTMGNLELHLIKGTPSVPDTDSLIVGHISVETDRPDLLFQRLKENNVKYQMNVSVPDASSNGDRDGSGYESFDVEDMKKGAVVQYFVQDPDGYYFELCNCDILTPFCFGTTDTRDEEVYEAPKLSMQTLSSVVTKCKQLVNKTRGNIAAKNVLLENQLSSSTPVEEACVDKLSNLMSRKGIWGDKIQGYSEEDMVDALKTSGNDVPLALLILEDKYGSDLYFVPPAFVTMDGARYQPEPQTIPVLADRSI